MPRLDAARWAALSPLLDRALDMAEDDRAAWLASLDAGDPALARALRALLDEHRDLGRDAFLDGAAAMPAPRSLAGTTLGAYTLVEPIGHGGMGSVWRAERTDGRFDARVAVKLLNASLVGRSGDERFRREGTILARLTHAHIAHAIDAGVSPGGQPYLVMEYVDGVRNTASGETVQATDPGRAMFTGRWADIGKFKGPILRGLAARARYFHNGSAATIADVVAFYDTRFHIGLTPQEMADLVAFLGSL